MKGTGHPWKIWLVKVAGMEGFGWTDVPDEHTTLGAAFGFRRTTRAKALERRPWHGVRWSSADSDSPPPPPAIIWLAPSCSQCYGMDPDGRTWCETPDFVDCEGKPDGSVCKAGCIPYERDHTLDMEWA